ncbi:hypothetical protein BJV85_004068 [Clostridium acetobutylicum]|uniref:hypothetical protein n=2 Tax=Clostridium acetobutylicum TaxID=1488 RepID=UPI000212AA70|nr:hypothetical protein [Clostridium acetobutylicum]AEI34926.1 Hypothetical Protein SMB_L007 [Clostridium acetobutylicum DSM 1731]MBC2396166.1 hypothetical protein [Clostridium acetobutylicum]NOV90894.1 hypothetical protein [Clostridium acetobutylicum]NRY58893.1 hypothetical protein [Clostridium acetobutylicum]NRY58903.1 hypothetical protein [Clostridium acetobutylicum]
MVKQEFNKLDIKEQLAYVNRALMDGKSLRGISTSLQISKTIIRDRFQKIGYIFNAEKRQYVKDTDILHKGQTIKNKTIRNAEYKGNTCVFNADDTSKIVYILKNYEDIKELLAWFNKQKNVVEPQNLKINRNRLNGAVKITTVRLYINVWEKFKSFMKQYQEYKSKDLVTMALLEFMDKYKK